MNRSTRAALLAAMSVTLAAPMAMARGDGDRAGGDRLRMLDLDGDGQITLQEAQSAFAARFAAADTDGNGALSRAEMTAQAQTLAAERVARRFDRLDVDGSGEVSQAELPGPRGDRIARMFDRVDANDDGVLTPDELQDIRARHRR